jgi:putative alpha-1,2-mannosidase
MSAWYLFSALGFYPGISSLYMDYNIADDRVVDPASATYVIGAPFFDFISMRFPGASRPLSITARGASDGLKYVRSITIDGNPIDTIVITHERIKNGADIVFEMASTPQSWGCT